MLRTLIGFDSAKSIIQRSGCGRGDCQRSVRGAFFYDFLLQNVRVLHALCLCVMCVCTCSMCVPQICDTHRQSSIPKTQKALTLQTRKFAVPRKNSPSRCTPPRWECSICWKTTWVVDWMELSNVLTTACICGFVNNRWNRCRSWLRFPRVCWIIINSAPKFWRCWWRHYRRSMLNKLSPETNLIQIVILFTDVKSVQIVRVTSSCRKRWLTWTSNPGCTALSRAALTVGALPIPHPLPHIPTSPPIPLRPPITTTASAGWVPHRMVMAPAAMCTVLSRICPRVASRAIAPPTVHSRA